VTSRAPMRARHTVLAAAAAGLLVGGVAVARATSTEVTVCIAPKGAGMRYAASGVCRAGETKLVLGQAGAAGATGARGAAGATGAAGGYPGTIVPKEINGAHTLVLSDAGKLLYSLEHTTVTVPLDTAADFAIGTRIELVNVKYLMWVTPASGVTINGVTSGLIPLEHKAQYDAEQGSGAVLVKKAANEWYLLKPLKET